MDTDEGLDLLGNICYQGFDKMIIHAKSITSDFFELKNEIAGQILQKFSNYRMPLAIVGDFTRLVEGECHIHPHSATGYGETGLR